MSAASIALLGAVAGLTIFLGLPIGRLRAPMPKVKALLNATAVGILVFLLWDVLAHAWEPIDAALSDEHLGAAVGNGLVLAGGLAVSLLGLAYFDRWVSRRRARAAAAPQPAPAPEREMVSVGAGAGVPTVTGADSLPAPVVSGWRG